MDGEAGDLKFVVRQLPHPKFVRKGSNLMYNASISLLDALVGFTKEIEHLDGHKVTLHSDGVTRPGMDRTRHRMLTTAVPMKPSLHSYIKRQVISVLLVPVCMFWLHAVHNVTKVFARLAQPTGSRPMDGPRHVRVCTFTRPHRNIVELR